MVMIRVRGMEGDRVNYRVASGHLFCRLLLVKGSILQGIEELKFPLISRGQWFVIETGVSSCSDDR